MHDEIETKQAAARVISVRTDMTDIGSILQALTKVLVCSQPIRWISAHVLITYTHTHTRAAYMYVSGAGAETIPY